MSRTIQPPTMHTKLVAASISDMVQEWYQGKCEVPPMQADLFERRISRFQSDLSQAAVAAALEAAARVCDGFSANHKHFAETPGTHWENATLDNNRAITAEYLASAIRALITPSQHDALAAHVAKARAEDAAKIAQIADGYDQGGDRAIATGIRTVLAALAQIGAKP